MCDYDDDEHVMLWSDVVLCVTMIGMIVLCCSVMLCWCIIMMRICRLVVGLLYVVSVYGHV